MATLRELANRLDARAMLGHLRNFPADLAVAWEKSESWDLTAIESRTFAGVICLGMGGSASGGDFLSCLSDADGCLPFVTHRGYDIPTWLSENWLVLATSYSGNTEETLYALEKCQAKGAEIAIITSGGKLKKIAQEKMKDLNAIDIKEATKIICGSARSMGIEVKE